VKPNGLCHQFPHVIMVGTAVWRRVIQLLWSNLPVQISQEKAKRAGDIPEWFVEQLIEEIIPNVRTHSLGFELIVDERIRQYRAIDVLRAHSRFYLPSPGVFPHPFFGFDSKLVCSGLRASDKIDPLDAMY
jgi:hypothetical protein